MAACILCVEDEPSLLADLLEELQDAGYQVLGASNAEQALAHLQRHQPDLVLCDVMLGDGQPDGYYIYEYLRSKCPHLDQTPFILLTALGHREALLRGRRQGVDDYLVKPIDYDMLLASVASRLASVQRLHDSFRSLSHSREYLQQAFAQLPGAAFLCKTQGHLLYANPVAQELAQQQVWAVKNEKLIWPRTVSEKVQVSQLFAQAQAQPGQRFVTALEQESGEPLLLSVLAFEGEQSDGLLALFISAAGSQSLPNKDALAVLFGLTASESKVALLMAQGCSRDEVAQRLGVSTTTVAFHLRNLFSKTGAARQAELVSLVLAAGWALPDLPRTA